MKICGIFSGFGKFLNWSLNSSCGQACVMPVRYAR